MVTEEQYLTAAQQELADLIDALDALEADELEAELESDILTLEFADGTRYVVNSHRAAKQIWMAAGHSAWHFDWNPGESEWRSDKSGEELWAVLERAIRAKLPQVPPLSRV